MKTRNLMKVLFFITLINIGCSKNDDTEQYIESTPQYPMKSLIENGELELTSTIQNKAYQLEIGYRFKTFKNGTVTELGIRLPNNKEYRVTLWNAETEEILVTKQILSSSGLLSFEAIEPVHINSGVEYFISVNTNDYYIFRDPENMSNSIFPVESGDFLIKEYGLSQGAGQNFPVAFSSKVYLGIVDMKFVSEN